MNNALINVEILPIAAEHIESFHRCLDCVARERLYLAFVAAPSLATMRSFVEANIAHNWPQVVAVKDKHVLGWCDILPKTMEGFTHCGRLGMGVLPGFRGYGLGQQLVLQALDKARDQKLERIEVEVFASNDRALKLYKKLGFVIEGVHRKARKLDGRYDDIVSMALLL